MAEKKYYWLKMPKGFLDKHYMKIMRAVKPNGAEICLFYIWLITESADHAAELRCSTEIPYDAEMLSFASGFKLEIVKKGLELFEKLELISYYEDGTIFMIKGNGMIGSETAAAGRMRNYRNRNNVTDGCAEVTDELQKSDEHIEIDIDIEKEIEKEIDKDSKNICAPKSHKQAPSEEDLQRDFAIIYGIYPKKTGRTNAFSQYKLWVSPKGKDVGGKRYHLTNKQIYIAVQNYVRQQEESGQDELQYWKNFDTLMGRQLLDYVDWGEEAT